MHCAQATEDQLIYIRIVEVEGTSPLPLSWRYIEINDFALFQQQLLDKLLEGKQYELRLATEQEALAFRGYDSDWKRIDLP